VLSISNREELLAKGLAKSSQIDLIISNL
jgi:hypothetical protein